MTNIGMFAALIAAGCAVVASLWLLRWCRNPERRLEQAFSTFSSAQLRDFVIPDGTGGEIQLDCLLLTPSGLVVLDINDTQGTVFAGERLDLWSATSAGARITFDNPLPLLQARVDAVEQLARGIKVEGRILFTAETDFPKGHPPEVTTLAALQEALAPHQQNTKIDGSHHPLAAQWESVVNAVVK